MNIKHTKHNYNIFPLCVCEETFPKLGRVALIYSSFVNTEDPEEGGDKAWKIFYSNQVHGACRAQKWWIRSNALRSSSTLVMNYITNCTDLMWLDLGFWLSTLFIHVGICSGLCHTYSVFVYIIAFVHYECMLNMTHHYGSSALGETQMDMASYSQFATIMQYMHHTWVVVADDENSRHTN